MLVRIDKDRLRAEYFKYLPEIRRVTQQLEAEIRYYTLPVLRDLGKHEQLIIKSRVKECESAVDTFIRKSDRKRGEGAKLINPQSGDPSILQLPDLAGIRVLVFPNERKKQVDEILLGKYQGWEFDPIPNALPNLVVPKYNGYCKDVSEVIRGEYQIVPMLLGLFWDVEHTALYKYLGVGNSSVMNKELTEVYTAMSNFEEGIARFVKNFDE